MILMAEPNAPRDFKGIWIFKSVSENCAEAFGGSFVRGLRWSGRYSPLRGCPGQTALAPAKIPRRLPQRNFQTRSKEIWLSADLSIMEKVLFVEIHSLDNERGCFASNRYFAGFFKISERQVGRYVARVQMAAPWPGRARRLASPQLLFWRAADAGKENSGPSLN